MWITEKGQVTIPQSIRNKVGLLPHTQAEFEIDGKGVRIVKKNGRRGESLSSQMRGKTTVKMSTKQIMSLMRGS